MSKAQDWVEHVNATRGEYDRARYGAPEPLGLSGRGIVASVTEDGHCQFGERIAERPLKAEECVALANWLIGTFGEKS